METWDLVVQGATEAVELDSSSKRVKTTELWGEVGGSRLSCALRVGQGREVVGEGGEGGGSPSYAHAGEAAHQVRHKNSLVLMSKGADDSPFSRALAGGRAAAREARKAWRDGRFFL
ncbi:hypothetical protein E2C01_003151 [Portunus trituberculatus]|uniref:Uncharacterized protein n=1 Tax=Portunus trituberculatus TaxID=210409 RepID=A0A5B7CMY6_PORTR|nr:hypothetical protein [Portunus trituberculatus]